MNISNHLANHAVSELLQMGYKVDGDTLTPPEKLSEFACKFFGVAPAAGAAPTDAEIEAFREAFDWEGYTDPRVAQRAFGRAVLARWGAAAPAQEAEDAVRYRWLRDKSQVVLNRTWLGGISTHNRDGDFLCRDAALAALDAAIDAARAQQEGGAV